METKVLRSAIETHPIMFRVLSQDSTRPLTKPGSTGSDRIGSDRVPDRTLDRIGLRIGSDLYIFAFGAEELF